jgi:hypothetical protein
MLVVALFLMTCLLLSLDAFRAHFGEIRENVFLISDNSFYQRPSNFMIIAAVLASTLLAQSLAHPAGDSWHGILATASVALYVALLAVLTISSQLVGSNAALVVILVLGIGTLCWILRPRLRRWKRAMLFSRRTPTLIQLIRKSLARLAANGLLLVAAAIVVIFIALSFSDLRLEQFRIVGFSEGRIGGNSLSSRIDLLRSNFLTQFGYAPIFGNLNVDVLTTGEGSYAHSLISFLSHVGIVGTALFIAYLTAALREQYRTNPRLLTYYNDIDIAEFRLIVAAVIIGFSFVATFFTWMPLWFSLAFLFPPIAFRNNYPSRTLVDPCAHDLRYLVDHEVEPTSEAADAQSH